MNTNLYDMIQKAECRYPNESELGAIRDYAVGMATRLEVARKLQQLEPVVLTGATDAYFERNPDALRATSDARGRLSRDLSTTLKYVAGAYVRDDEAYFRKAYAEWLGELLRTSGLAAASSDAHQLLKAAINDTFDGMEARKFNHYIDILLEALAKGERS